MFIKKEEYDLIVYERHLANRKLSDLQDMYATLLSRYVTADAILEDLISWWDNHGIEGSRELDDIAHRARRLRYQIGPAKPNHGGFFDDYLKEDGIFDEVESEAKKRVSDFLANRDNGKE